MNEVLKVIAERFSCRGFDGKPVEMDKLNAIARAGVQAPTSMDRQPYRIVVINDKTLIDQMDMAAMDVLKNQEDTKFYERMMDRGGKIFYNAPSMYVVLKQPGSDLDIGIVTENIALASFSLGLGNVICGMARMAFTSEKKDEFVEKIGFPEGFELGMTVLVGYPTVTKEPHEPDMSKISFVNP